MRPLAAEGLARPSQARHTGLRAAVLSAHRAAVTQGEQMWGSVGAFRRLCVIVLAFSFAGCSGDPEQSAPPGTPTPIPTGTSTTQPEAATASPISSSTPTDRPTPASSSEPDGIWRVVESPGFGATVSAIRAASNSFVAAGWVEAPTARCPERRIATIWWWRGERWSGGQQDGGRNAAIFQLVFSSYGFGPLAAVGYEGSQGCAGDGLALWGASDKSDFYRVSAVRGPTSSDRVVDAAGLERHLLVTGWYGDDEEHMGVWLSERNQEEARRWRRAADPPPARFGETITQLAVMGDLVAGFDDTVTRPVWFSRDGGDSWTNSDFQPTYHMRIIDSMVFVDDIVAIGSACCTLPDVRAGIALSSSDGATWTSLEPEALRSVPQAVIYTSAGYIAVGRETYLSADGNSWRVGPPLPGYDGESELVAAANEDGRDLEAVIVVGGGKTWSARLRDLAQFWSSESPAAERPGIGIHYPYNLLTHCGPEGGTIRFDLRTWLPDPSSLVDGGWPTSFDNPGEQGTLMLVAEDLLEFTGDSRGDLVRYQPTDDPPEQVPCF